MKRRQRLRAVPAGISLGPGAIHSVSLPVGASPLLGAGAMTVGGQGTPLPSSPLPSVMDTV